MEELPQPPRIRSIKEFLYIFISGLFMGAADVVPGVSGGTMAFIFGIYDRLIEGVRSLCSRSWLFLLRGRVVAFSQTIAWDFMGALILGIILSLAIMSRFIHSILNDETGRIYLFSAFLGMIVGTVLYCRKLIDWSAGRIVVLLLGAFVTFSLTGSNPFGETGAGVFPQSIGHFQPWMFFCGAVAVCAMMLPGISGSYLLALLGVYSHVIAAVAQLSYALPRGEIPSEAFWLLFNVLAGIIFGAALFSHAISWFLRHYHGLTIAALIGLMIGSLKVLWPFWTYAYVYNPLSISGGPQLVTVEPYVPSVGWPLFLSVFWFAAGVFLVLGIETAAKFYRRTRRSRP